MCKMSFFVESYSTFRGFYFNLLLSITSDTLYSYSPLLTGVLFIMASSRGPPSSEPGPSCSNSGPRIHVNIPDPNRGSSHDPSHGPLFCPFCWFGHPRRYFSRMSDLDNHLRYRHEAVHSGFQQRRVPCLNHCAYCICEYNFCTSDISNFL
jgi:hypothetical protein